MARVAFVTGGTRGIGRAIVERLCEDGLKVAAGYSGNDAAAEACAKEFGVMVVKGNVGVFEDCVRAAQLVEAELGPIDVLVNNAGITRDGAFHKMTPDQWGDVIRVNMDSVFNMTRQVIVWACAIAALAGSSTFPRSTARRARSARPTIRRPRPG